MLETHPSLPEVDDSGEHLLRHARIYTLAEKFGMDLLKKLAASKIHCINSTARGEIAYARYVYANTDRDDTSMRAPIASFWAARSHALRAEAEDEFQSLCLEYPEFGYEVLSKLVLFISRIGFANVVFLLRELQHDSFVLFFFSSIPLFLHLTLSRISTMGLTICAQRVFWTTSSSGSAMKRCTRPQGADANGRE